MKANDDSSTPESPEPTAQRGSVGQASALRPPHPLLRWHSSSEGRARSRRLVRCHSPATSLPPPPWPSVDTWPDAPGAPDLTYRATTRGGSTSEASRRSRTNGAK